MHLAVGKKIFSINTICIHTIVWQHFPPDWTFDIFNMVAHVIAQNAFLFDPLSRSSWLSQNILRSWPDSLFLYCFWLLVFWMKFLLKNSSPQMNALTRLHLSFSVFSVLPVQHEIFSFTHNFEKNACWEKLSQDKVSNLQLCCSDCQSLLGAQAKQKLNLPGWEWRGQIIGDKDIEELGKELKQQELSLEWEVWWQEE